MIIQELLSKLEELAPPSLQESYDNSGLLTGDAQDALKGVLLCLDCTEEVVSEAQERNCNLIIAHHPIVFGGIKKLTPSNYVNRTVIAAIKNDIAIYAIHTNLDNVENGVNKKLAETIGLQNLQTLLPKQEVLQKLVTYAPTDKADSIRAALFEVGGGHIGKYAHCSFNSEGTGTFKASHEANPFVGERGEEHHEAETRIELVFPKHIKGTLISALLTAHPYEEVAYEVYQIENTMAGVGSGMIGELSEPTDFSAFLQDISTKFNVSAVRHTKVVDRSIHKIAVCGGSGSFLLSQAKRLKADVFVTADFKYHDFFDAEGEITIVDLGHYESEQFTPLLIQEYLQEIFPTFAVLLSRVNTNPIEYFIPK